MSVTIVPEPPPAPKAPPTRFSFQCRCGAAGTAVYGPVYRRGGADGWLVSCWRCTAAGVRPGDYLRALAKEVGASGGSVLLDDPLHHLGHLVTAVGTGERDPAPLPNEEQLRKWARQLFHEDAWGWLRKARGLSPATIRKAHLGYDGRAVVIPIFGPDGALVNVKRRYWPDPWFTRPKGDAVWKQTLTGRGAQLYPNVPAKGRIILCAGETDALLARQHGLPAVTTTCGATLPDALVPELMPGGRDIDVVYDVGEEIAAEATAGKLRAVGANAVAVGLGLPARGQDLTDFFLSGRTARDLRALARLARREAS